MKIVAISGKMHSGKSFVARHLVDRHGFKQLAFAAPLKQDLIDYGFPRDAVETKPGWMRQLMQAYGQGRRAVDPDYWSDRLRQYLDLCLEDEKETWWGPDESCVVIDDMRFENEADMLLLFGEENPDVEVVLLRLERGDYSRTGLAGAEEISETALDEYPEFHYAYTVTSGDLYALRRIADRIGEGFRGRTSSASPEGTAE